MSTRADPCLLRRLQSLLHSDCPASVRMALFVYLGLIILRLSDHDIQDLEVIDSGWVLHGVVLGHRGYPVTDTVISLNLKRRAALEEASLSFLGWTEAEPPNERVLTFPRDGSLLEGESLTDADGVFRLPVPEGWKSAGVIVWRRDGAVKRHSAARGATADLVRNEPIAVVFPEAHIFDLELTRDGGTPITHEELLAASRRVYKMYGGQGGGARVHLLHRRDGLRNSETRLAPWNRVQVQSRFDLEAVTEIIAEFPGWQRAGVPVAELSAGDVVRVELEPIAVHKWRIRIESDPDRSLPREPWETEKEFVLFRTSSGAVRAFGQHSAVTIGQPSLPGVTEAMEQIERGSDLIEISVPSGPSRWLEVALPEGMACQPYLRFGPFPTDAPPERLDVGSLETGTRLWAGQRAIGAAVQEWVEVIRKRTGIRVLAPGWKFDGGFGLHGEPTDLVSLEEYLPLLADELSRVPYPFLKCAGVQDIVLGGNLTRDGGPLGGTSGLFGVTIYLRVPELHPGQAAESARWFRKVIHHELFHLVDSRLTIGSWPRPPRVAADEEQRHAGFVSAYAATTVMEDKADTFACMMADSEWLSRCMERDPLVRKKVAILEEALHRLIPEMDQEFWRSLRQD